MRKTIRELNKTVTLRMDKKMLTELQKLADREEVSVSALLRDIAKDGIKLRKSANWRDRLFDD